MVLFRKKKPVEEPDEKRDVGEADLDTALRAALGSSTITVENACEIPAVRSCISFLSGTIAGLPVRLYKTENGKREEIVDDYRLRLLNAETGDLLDAFQLKCTLVRDYLLAGNGYVYVNWVGQTIASLNYVDPTRITAEIGTDPIFKQAVYNVNGQTYRDFQFMRVLRDTKDGVTGRGLVTESSTLLELMINSLKYENRMVRTGAKKGFLKAKEGRKLTQVVIDQLKESWKKLYGNDSEETCVVLNDGIEFQDAGSTAVDAQLNENKTTNAHEIYSVFCICPSVIEGGASADDRKNTIASGVKPIVDALNVAINRSMLLESEKDTLRFEIDMDALDGTDLLARYQAYEVAVRNGWMQLDEVRYEEGMNPLGLKFVRLGLDTVIYDPETEQIYTPNTKEWATMRKSSQKGGGKTK